MLDFPSSPTNGTVSNGYTWDGEKWCGPAPQPDAPSDGGRYYRQNGAWVKDTSLRLLQKSIIVSSTPYSRATMGEVLLSDGAQFAPISQTSKVFATAFTYVRNTGVSLAVDDQASNVSIKYYNGTAYVAAYALIFGDANRVTVAPSVIIWHHQAFPTIDVSSYRNVGGTYDKQILLRLHGTPNYANLTLESFVFYCQFEEFEA